eukprot:scaffold363_cov331-Pavlova_lutheri.AAC.7
MVFEAPTRGLEGVGHSPAVLIFACLPVRRISRSTLPHLKRLIRVHPFRCQMCHLLLLVRSPRRDTSLRSKLSTWRVRSFADFLFLSTLRLMGSSGQMRTVLPGPFWSHVHRLYHEVSGSRLPSVVVPGGQPSASWLGRRASADRLRSSRAP